MNKKILIVGGSHSELPLIKEAKKRGDYVITTGSDVGGLGHKESDEYFQGDYSDKEYIYNLAVDKNVDAIISGCNDFAYLSTAYATEKLGFKGHDSYDVAKMIHHKDSFRQCIQQLGIRTPKCVKCICSEDAIKAARKIGFPVLIKPVDLTGGKGVQICNTEEEISIAYKRAMTITRENVLIVEEYIQGTNHGVSVLLKNQKVVFGFVDNEQYFINPYLVSGACYPSSVSKESIEKLYIDIEKFAQKYKLVDGLFHVQCILKDDILIMIDPCRRTPGDLYVLLVKYATGVNYPLEILKAEMGETLEDEYMVVEKNVARECIMTNCNGIVKQIDTKELEGKVMEQYIWGKQGDVVEDYLKYKAGIIIWHENTKEQLYKRVAQFHQLVQIVMEGK